MARKNTRGSGAKKSDNKNLIKITKNVKNVAKHIPGVRLIGDVVNQGKKVHKNLTKKDEPKKTRTDKYGRKLSSYEIKQADRKKAMQDRARARHKAWKEERARKKEARKNRK